MIYYFWIFVWLMFMGWVVPHTVYYRKEKVPGLQEPVSCLTPTMAFIIILPIILWAGYRSFWFADTGAYYSGFKSYSTTLSGFIADSMSSTKDRGFYFVSALFKLIIPNARAYFLAIALFQGCCMMKFFRRYSQHYVLALFLFVASTDIFSWMFNGMRQFLAVAITLLAAPYIFEKRYARAIVLIVVASLFHQSALLLIPFIFLVQGSAWNAKTVLFILAATLAVVFVGQFTSLMDTALEGTQYTNVVSDYTSWSDDGTNPIRVLVYSIPAIFALMGRSTIEAEGDRVIKICANFSVITAGFYLISMATSGIFIGRIPIYFSLYQYILLPWELEHIFKEKSQKLLWYGMVFGYMGFYVYSLYF